jgi:hypothetical protein
MASHVVLRQLLTGLVVVVMSLWGANVYARDAFALRPGHLYVNGDGQLYEFDSSLNPVATLLLPGTTVIEGLAINPAGRLVCSVFKQNPNSTRTHHLFEIDSAGQVVRDLDLGIEALDRAAHLDIDSTGRIYAASTPNLLEVQPDFSAFRTMPRTFNRSSGVAVGPDNKVYATDQNQGVVAVFDQARNFERTFGLAALPTGIDFGSDPSLLYYCAFNADALRRLDLTTGATSFVSGPFNDISDVEFAPDGSYYVSWERGHVLEHRSAQHATLQTVVNGDFGDAIVMYVPEPVTPMLLALTATGLAGRRARPPRTAGAREAPVTSPRPAAR